MPLTGLHDKHTERGWHRICADQEEAAATTAEYLKQLWRGGGSKPSSKGRTISHASASSQDGEREDGATGAEVGFVDGGEVTKRGEDGMETKEGEDEDEGEGEGVAVQAEVGEMGADDEGGVMVKVTAWNDDGVGEGEGEGEGGPADVGPNGQLELAFKWVFNPDLAPTYFEGPDLYPDREVNELKVAVIQARGEGVVGGLGG